MAFKISVLLPLLIIIQTLTTVQGHIFLHSLTAGGEESTECLRAYSPQKNSPIKDTTAKEMMCNAGTSPAKSTCAVKAGSSVTFQFYAQKPEPNDEIVDDSHVGPCSVYLSKADASGAPSGWFKIFEKGYDAAKKQWCSDQLIAARGKLDVKLPADLEDGKYIFRTEFIALHEAGGKASEGRGAQFYIHCGDIELEGGSGSLKPATVDIPSPQWATDESPGVLIDVYGKTDLSNYKIPGPPVLAASIGSIGAGSGNETSTNTGSPGNETDYSNNPGSGSHNDSDSKPNAGSEYDTGSNPGVNSEYGTGSKHDSGSSPRPDAGPIATAGEEVFICRKVPK